VSIFRNYTYLNHILASQPMHGCRGINTIFMGIEEREKLWNFMKGKWSKNAFAYIRQEVYIRYSLGLLDDVMLLSKLLLSYR
jgi:hypothetical protein